MNDVLNMMIEAAREEAALGAPAGAACACGTGVEETLVTERVPIGGEGGFFEVEVPITRCLTCGVSYRDHRAEGARSKAARHYLHLLTPDEVKAVRVNLGMTRKEFGDAYGIPPASMERWENGRVNQNRSIDTLLRGLRDTAFATQLDRRRPPAAAATNLIHVDFAALRKRPASEREDVLRRSASFVLRACA